MGKEDGFRGYMKGNGANVVRIAPFSAYEMFFYELYKVEIFGNPKQMDNWSKFVCGGLTGMTASTLTYPLDLIRTYLSINVESGQKMSISEQTKVIYRSHGLLGFYRGWFASMVGITPYVGIKMATFDILKTKFVTDKNDPRVGVKNLVIGAFAGTFSVTVSYPTDVFRRLL